MSTLLKMRDRTKLFLTNRQKESLRTTIPMSIVKQWNLTEGDYLGWRVEYDKSIQKMVAIVMKDES